MVNDEFLGHVRKGRCTYIRGDTERLTSHGVLANVRGRHSNPGDEGEKKEVSILARSLLPALTKTDDEQFKADIVVLATGFKKPVIDFLPKDLFPEGYDVRQLLLVCLEREVDISLSPEA